ncbi:MAG: imidazolonepropionase [Pyrinomonadaceae bacterium]
MKVDLIIINAFELLTCASTGKAKKGPTAMQDVGLIRNGAVAVSAGKIAGVGQTAEILRDFESENVLDAAGKSVLPGLVECHTHVVFGGQRINEFELRIKGATYLEIMEAGGGIISTMHQTRDAGLEQLAVQSQKRLDQLLEHGVTTCEVKTGYGLSTESELKMLRTIFLLDENHPLDLIPTFLPAHAFPPEFRNREEDYVDLICEEMLPAASRLFFEEMGEEEAERHLARRAGIIFADVFCEKNAFTLEQSKKVLRAAKDLGFRLKAHTDEFTNLGCARLAIELGAVSIDHLDAISTEEIELLARSETVGVVTPTVNFNFGSTEFADARRFIDAGCAVALSTDFNPGSAPCPSLPNAMAIACRYQKLLPSEAINAATINAAFAVGLGNRVGSIETGKQADLIILDSPDHRVLAYEFGGNPIEKVFKNGRIVL